MVFTAPVWLILVTEGLRREFPFTWTIPFYAPTLFFGYCWFTSRKPKSSQVKPVEAGHSPRPELTSQPGSEVGAVSRPTRPPVDPKVAGRIAGRTNEELYLQWLNSKIGGKAPGGHFHSLEPTEFERLVAQVLRQEGYTTEVTPASNDGGKDIVAHKAGKKIVVECKRYGPDKAVGRPYLQKLQGAMLDTEADSAMFVTSSSFSAEATAYAEKHKIRLIDGIELRALLEKHRLASDVGSHSDGEEKLWLHCPKCASPVLMEMRGTLGVGACCNEPVLAGDVDPNRVRRVRNPATGRPMFVITQGNQTQPSRRRRWKRW